MNNFRQFVKTTNKKFNIKTGRYQLIAFPVSFPVVLENNEFIRYESTLEISAFEKENVCLIGVYSIGSCAGFCVNEDEWNEIDKKVREALKFSKK